MLSLFAAGLLFAAAEPAVAEPPAAAEAPPAAAAAPAAKPEKEKLICWNETPLGTRFSQRVCATREEVEARKRRAQDWARSARPGLAPE